MEAEARAAGRAQPVAADAHTTASGASTASMTAAAVPHQAPWLPHAAGQLLGYVAGLAFSLVLLELLALLLLGALALKGGDVRTYFANLLPHPALSHRLDRIEPHVFSLFRHEGHVNFGGKVVGAYEWHPLLGHYRTTHPDGRSLRGQPTFAANELAVYLVGGSVVEGGEVAASLQEFLQDTVGDRYAVRVFNEGVGGYMSTQEMVLTMTKILPWGNPHYVIAFDGYNDWIATVYNVVNDFKRKTGVADEYWPRPELSWFHYWFEEWQARKAIETVGGASTQLGAVLSKRLLFYSYTGWLVNHLNNWVTYAVVMKATGRDPRSYASNKDYERTPVLPRERAGLQVMNARLMAEASRARNARFFWVLQPALPCRAAAMTPFERDSYAFRPAPYWDSLNRYYQDIRDIVGEDPAFWQSRFLDLSCPTPDVADSFFSDTVHLTGAGGHRSAEYLAQLIVEDLGRREAEQSSGTTSDAYAIHP